MIKLGISPCPNDTFMFYHLLNGRLKNNIKLRVEDVQKLNQLCLTQKLDISKVSFHVLGLLREDYKLLSAGAAIGYGCGPLLVSKKRMILSDLKHAKIAIPGEHTTANLLLRCLLPETSLGIPMKFSSIMSAVLNEDVDAGLIIHESRFTYESLGLNLILDLGELWEKETGFPIPLGGIIAKRNLCDTDDFNCELQKSVQQARIADYAKQMKLNEFVRKFSQEIDDDVCRKHIETYVTKESEKLSEKSCQAIEFLFKTAEEKGIFPKSNVSIF